VDESQTIRVSIEEAATLLGIEKGSVKKRIQRGKLRSEKDAAGVTWVYLDRSETVQDQSQGRSETDRDELVVELRDRVRSLERRLDEEGESRRRADTIIAQLTQANTALNERLRELEAPQTSEEAAEGGAEAVAGLLATEGDTEPRWMRSRWADWLIPTLLGYVIPTVITVLGSIYVYIRAVNDQTIAAVLGTLTSLLALGLSRMLSRILRLDREELKRQAEWQMSIHEALSGVVEAQHREAWFEERLKENPEMEQRMEELREEYEKEHPS
jgi:hypothetical protein